MARRLKYLLSVFLFTVIIGCSNKADDAKVEAKVFKRMDCYFFFIPDCPVCKSEFQKVMALKEKYQKKGLTIKPIYSEPFPDLSDVKKTLINYGFDIPFICDSTLQIARTYKIETTPQFILTDSSGTILYSGALDDYYYSLGQHKKLATENYLEKAINCALANKDIELKYVKPIGCKINYPENY